MKLEMELMDRVQTPEQLDQVFARSRAVLFKHSTRCPISAHALSEMERFHLQNPEVPIFVLDVIENRRLSEQVTRRTGVRHESPQLLLMEEGRVRWHASHFDVTARILEEKLPVSSS